MEEFSILSPSTLTKGNSRECYENARKEFLAQRAKGNNPQYWVGLVHGHSVDGDPEKKTIPLHHAWVTVNGVVHDPTYFKYGRGNFSNLPERPAHQEWRPGVKYHGMYEVPESQLKDPLKFFPKKESMQIMNLREMTQELKYVNESVENPHRELARYHDRETEKAFRRADDSDLLNEPDAKEAFIALAHMHKQLFNHHAALMAHREPLPLGSTVHEFATNHHIRQQGVNPVMDKLHTFGEDHHETEYQRTKNLE